MPIDRDEYDQTMEDFNTLIKDESKKQANEEQRVLQEDIVLIEEDDREEIEILESYYQTENMMNHRLLTQMSDNEQEIYEKDQYIQRLENEIGLLKVSSYHHSRERII